MKTMIASRLTDGELMAEVARLATGAREATALLIERLAELYARRLHEPEGFSSLFTYCTEVLRLSEHEAYDRMKAAKVAHWYPAVLRLLASAQVNLTTVRLLAPHLTRRNHEELFAAAGGKRKRQVQELLASRFPKPDVAFSARKLPTAPVAPASRPIPVVPAQGHVLGDLATGDVKVSPTSEPVRAAIPSPPPPPVHPLAPDRYRVTFTATAETCEMLELAQDLLRHAIPSGDPAQVFARALSVLVEDLVRRKFAVTGQPRPGQAPGNQSRHIPAHVKRAVYVRDRGRCAFVGTHGRRCGERAFVEFDHHPIPYARGGPSTVDNLELRCRTHNRYLAERIFGRVERYAGAKARRDMGAGRPRVRDDAFRPGTTAASVSPATPSPDP